MCPDFCYIFPDMVIGTIKENSLTNEKHKVVTSTNLTLMKRLFVTNGKSRKSDRNLSPVYTSKDGKDRGTGMCPDFHYISQLPTTPNGKVVDRKLIDE